MGAGESRDIHEGVAIGRIGQHYVACVEVAHVNDDVGVQFRGLLQCPQCPFFRINIIPQRGEVLLDDLWNTSASKLLQKRIAVRDDLDRASVAHHQIGEIEERGPGAIASYHAPTDIQKHNDPLSYERILAAGERPDGLGPLAGADA